jgi:hypothetical protein
MEGTKMKMYIPEISDRIRLVDEWRFTLINEYRNESLWKFFESETAAVGEKRKKMEDRKHELERKFGYTYSNIPIVLTADEQHEYRSITEQLRGTQYHYAQTEVALPAGCELSVDRIYIRKGAGEWSSITFYLQSHPHTGFKRKPRFWAKLSDCNHIEFERA